MDQEEQIPEVVDCQPEPKAQARAAWSEAYGSHVPDEKKFTDVPWLFDASGAAEKRSEAFESVRNRSLREDAGGPVSRQKPRAQEPKKPTHWNFSFNVNREVVGAEQLEVDEDGELQPPSQDPKHPWTNQSPLALFP